MRALHAPGALRGMNAAEVEPKAADEERAFWLEYRRGLIYQLRAIEARYGLSGAAKPLEFKQHGKGGKPDN